MTWFYICFSVFVHFYMMGTAKQMPVTTTKLLHLVKSKHPCVERNLNSVVSVIKQSMQNAAAFETAAERLKEERMEKVRITKKVRLAMNIVLVINPERIAKLLIFTLDHQSDSCEGHNESKVYE